MKGIQKTGILGAMPEEVDGILSLMTDAREETVGMRTYYSGFIQGKAVVLAFSRWGKVAAATTVTTMIQRYGITDIIFTGVAGAIDHRLKVGDIVLGSRLVQHDMDASPLMPRFEIPLLGKDYFHSDLPATERAAKVIAGFMTEQGLHDIFNEDILETFHIRNPQVMIGDIASGDQFFSTPTQKEKLKTLLPAVLCVEMEGGAVAQVCYEHQIPFMVIRIISDSSDESAHVDFTSFITRVSSLYTKEIIRKILS